MTHALAVGVDLIEVDRVRTAGERYGDRFLHRVFTDDEREYCAGRWESLAARFAAKEAIGKALGSGWGDGVQWHEMEVVRDERGKPEVRLHGLAARLAAQQGLAHWALSLSHDRTHAIAFVVAQS